MANEEKSGGTTGRESRSTNGEPPELWRQERSFFSPLLPLATEEERRLRSRLLTISTFMLVFVVGMLGFMMMTQLVLLVVILVAMVYPFIWVTLTITQGYSNAVMDGKLYLKRVDYKVCPGCSYDMTTLDGEPLTCPECGRVTGSDERKAIWQSVYEQHESNRKV